MSNVYDAHRTAFAAVSAYVILQDGARVATVAFKHGNAVTAYVHWIGVEMVRATAKGGGYDRQSAAVGMAARKIPDGVTCTSDADVLASFASAARKDGGATWIRSLEDAGFTVIQAV